MKVALTSYPSLFQRSGGLQVQVRQTHKALLNLGLDARIVSLTHDRITDFDLVHVFAIINGNHRIVEVAKSLDRPVVVSSLIHAGWSKSMARRVALLDRLIGRLTGWEVRTSFGDARYGLSLADRVVALGSAERSSLVDWYGVSSNRIRIIPNGISDAYFHADPAPFRRRYSIDVPFVLCVGAISARKNQLGLVRALAGTGLQVVLIGPALGADRALLEAALAHDFVTYVPELDNDDPLLASAYAAATVTVLVSKSEVMPLCVLESLAAGTPAVLTKHHQMDLSLPKSMLVQVDPENESEVRAAIVAMSQEPTNRGALSDSVSTLSWAAVAEALVSCYAECHG